MSQSTADILTPSGSRTITEITRTDGDVEVSQIFR